MSFTLQSVTENYSSYRVFSGVFRKPSANTLTEKPEHSLRIQDKNSIIESPFERIVKRIKQARLPLEKKERLIRWLWAVNKAAGCSSAGGIPGEFERKMYQLIQLMEEAEKYDVDPEKARKHAKRIDELLKNLKERDEKETALNEKVSNAAAELDQLMEEAKSFPETRASNPPQEDSEEETE